MTVFLIFTGNEIGDHTDLAKLRRYLELRQDFLVQIEKTVTIISATFREWRL